MSRKWYRPSISLAAKCRVAFGAAVLVIIAAALFLPYRWMDKLVEQGKLEVAQAEVEHVLEDHFQGANGAPEAPGRIELTTAGAEQGVIKPLRGGRGTEASGGGEASGGYLLGSGSAERATEVPQTEWIRLWQGQGETIEDAFVRRGVAKFSEDRNRFWYFKPLKSAGVASEEDKESFGREMAAHLGAARPWRFLQAVRGQRSCMSAGCHGAGADKAGQGEGVAAGPPVFSEGELVGVISVVLPAGQISTTLLFNRIFIVGGGLLAGIFAVVTFYLITQRFILEPVRQLREAADQMVVPTEDQEQDQGEVEQKQKAMSWQDVMDMTEKIRTGDEFERLAVAFGHMLERLKEAHDHQEQARQALDVRLGELEEKNIALYESNKLKSEFLANVSHELRTPLNAIIGFAELLKEQAEQRAEAKGTRYASNVLDSGKLLLVIINDLLDLARIEAGKVEVHIERCSIREVAETLLNLTRTMVEQKRLNVHLVIAEDVGLIDTDPGKLQQILFNLLSNAIKFTPAQGRIDVAARRADDGYMELEIADNGPGIAAEDRVKIFEKFTQLDGSVTKEYSGTGLGLAIVKDLVGILGGQISVGDRDGKGTVFTVRLPTESKVAEPR